jgi:hypothetical protein
MKSVACYGSVPSSPILVILMMEALSSSETSVITRVTRRNIPEDAILLFVNGFKYFSSNKVRSLSPYEVIHFLSIYLILEIMCIFERLCGLVVRVPGY